MKSQAEKSKDLMGVFIVLFMEEIIKFDSFSMSSFHSFNKRYIVNGI